VLPGESCSGDPGTADLGSGILADGRPTRPVDYGVVVRHGPIAAGRLHIIHNRLWTSSRLHRPRSSAWNGSSSARTLDALQSVGPPGSVLLAAGPNTTSRVEATPNKSDAWRYGAADKEQCRDVRSSWACANTHTDDAATALAVAIGRRTSRMGAGRRRRSRGRCAHVLTDRRIDTYDRRFERPYEQAVADALAAERARPSGHPPDDDRVSSMGVPT